MRKRFPASLLLLTALSIAAAQSIPVEQYQLPNGMTVVLHVDKSLPVAAVNVWYRVGSKDERAGRSGFAHLFEHLMFTGTKRAPNFDTIMETGGGSNNATTSRDRTNYFSSGPSAFLPTLLWLEADRMEALADSMTQQKLDLQRDVVKNERRQRYENTPYGLVPETLSRLLYPPGHPYHETPIGTMQDIDAATLNDVQAFFDTYYVPSNASLVVAGDFDPAVVKPLIEQLFGDLPRGNDIARPAAPALNFQGVKRHTLTDRVQNAKTVMAWHSPAYMQAGDAELDLAATLLADGVGSRLYEELVTEKQLASDVSAYQQSQALGSVFVIDATLAPGASQDELESAIDEVLNELSTQAVTPEALKRQVAKYEFATFGALQSVQDKADALNRYVYHFGQADGFKRDLDRYRNATPQGVRETVARVLDPNRRVVLRVVPQAQSAPSSVNPRDQRPPNLPDSAFTLPEPTEFNLPNGLKVQYWQRAALPLMHVTAVVRGGSELDPTDRAGQSALLADMLDEGAGELNAADFQGALEHLGAQFGASTARRHTSASLAVTAENFAPAAKLFADALVRPRFDDAEFTRVQRVTVQDLEGVRDNTGTVASIVSQREFFGRDHPYGRPLRGYADTAGKVNLVDLRAQHARLFQPQNTTVFAAGSVDPEAFKAMLQSVLGDWRNSGPAYASPAYPAPANQKLRVVLVDKPGAPQTVVRFLMPAPPANDARSNALHSLNNILGGSFTSRLQQNLREEKGYTYGAGSFLMQDEGTGYLGAGASVETGVTGAAVKEFLHELTRLRQGDISDEEATKSSATRHADTISALSTLDGLVGTAVDYHTRGKSFSDLADELNALRRLRATDLNEVATDFAPYQRGVLVLVGDKAKITPQLQELNLPAPVEVKFD